MNILSFIVADGLDKNIVPNIWMIISSLTAALFLISIISYYFWGPTQRFLNRQKTILVNRNNETLLREEKSKQILNQQKKDFKKAWIQAKTIISKAQKKAEKIILQSNLKAEQNNKNLIKRSQEEIKANEIANKKHWKKYSSELAIVLAEKIIKKEIDSNIHEQLIDDFLKQ